MSHPTVLLCEPTSTPEVVGTEAQVTPRPLDVLLPELDGLASTTGWVELDGPAPGLHPDLEILVERLLRKGLRVRLIADARGLDPARVAGLVARGVGAVRLRRLAARPEAHDALVGRSGEGAALDVLEAAVARMSTKLELSTVVLPGVLPHLAELARHAAGLGVDLHVHAAPRGRTPPAEAALAALDELRAAADAVGARVLLHGLARPPGASRGAAPVVLGPAVWTFLREGVPAPSLDGGCLVEGMSPGALDRLVQLAGRPEDVGHHLAAWGCPALDLPASLGGPGRHDPHTPVPEVLAARLPEGATEALPGWTPAPGRRVVVVNPAMADKAMTLSSVPALVQALRSRGAEVELASAWGEGSAAEVEALRRRPDALPAAKAAEAAALAAVDLGGADLIVAPSWGSALTVLDRPDLPADARVVVGDFHLLDGLEAWGRRFVGPGRRPMDGGWWPSERVVLVSCFPSFVGLYRMAGVPMRQVLWRPYPVEPVGGGLPAEACRVAFAGGNQYRDWATLAGAAARLPAGTPLTIDLYTRHAPPPGLPAALAWRGTVDLSLFRARLSEARFVVVPVPYAHLGASGLTVVALALAAGRPVLAARTPAVRDHVRHGVDGWLVDPGDPKALAAALHRLATDDVLVAKLAAGARAAGARLAASTWAAELLDGAEPVRVWGQPGGPWRPWAPAEPPASVQPVAH